MNAKQRALIALGQRLRSLAYRFIAVTPTTHRILYERAGSHASLRSVFGWNRYFAADSVDPDIVEFLRQADVLEHCDGRLRSTVRFASIDDLVFAHSGFPTLERDSVFFGPDTYRFARLLKSALADVVGRSGLRVVDIGCGSGAGGLFVAKMLGAGTDVALFDISQTATNFSTVNAAINGIQVRVAQSDILQNLSGQVDLIIANPPYLVDDEERLYRHGGGELGIEIAGRIVKQALERLAKGGRLILYTGTPIICGLDRFFELVRPLLQPHAQHFVYEEIDPDVFGQELKRPAYAKVDRIAAVGLTVFK